MKTLGREAYEEIRGWMHRCCRPLELAVWQYHFEGGGRDAAIEALGFFQNGDGGFGKLLDSDNWNPASTPYNAYNAVRTLRDVGFCDISHPLYQGLLRYLERTPDRSRTGWDFTVPDNDRYPHAVWWNYSPEGNCVQNLGITAALAGFILRYTDRDTPLYGTAASYVDVLLDRLKALDKLGDVGLQGYCALTEDLEAAGLGDRFDLDALRRETARRVRDAIWLDSENFMVKPSMFIRDPGSRYYPGNEAFVERELDQLIDMRPQGGAWDIPWEWYNGGIYPKEFAISELWSRAAVTIGNLRYLRNFGRL